MPHNYDKNTRTHALRIFNAYCFYTVTMDTQTHLNIKFIRALPVCLKMTGVTGHVQLVTLYHWYYPDVTVP
jgi:hypothetical protein